MSSDVRRRGVWPLSKNRVADVTVKISRRRARHGARRVRCLSDMWDTAHLSWAIRVADSNVLCFERRNQNRQEQHKPRSSLAESVTIHADGHRAHAGCRFNRYGPLKSDVVRP